MNKNLKDFTDNQELIEIENLMLDKKYREAFVALIEMNLENLTQNLDDFIHTVLLIICLQYIDLVKCLDVLIGLTFSFGYRTIPTFHKFIDDICRKTETRFYEKKLIDDVNKKFLKTKQTTKNFIINANLEIDNMLKERKSIDYIDFKISEEEKSLEYLFKKFQQ